MLRTSLVLIVALAAGCGDDDGDDETPLPDATRPDAAAVDAGIDAADAATDAAPDAPPDAPADAAVAPYADLDEGCAPIFAQHIVPAYHFTIAPAHWAAMQDEFLHPQLSGGGSPIDPPYHPTQLHIVEGSASHDPPGVMFRLNGNTSWLQAIALDADPKMQFLVAFNKVDPEGRFEGLRKIKLDMPRGDWTFLQQRVALAWMRGRAAVPAQCANSARVYVNGAYYGLYANVEFQDKGFLTRIFGAADNDGDLWKSGREIKTNEETFSWAHIAAFWDTVDLPGIDAVVDLDTSMAEWASEAVIGDTDGYNQGRPNYYLYDRPSTGQFVWLANDLDTSLDADFLPPDTTPVFAPTRDGEARWERDWHHYLIALDDPAGVPRYVTALRAQLPRLDPAEVAAWIDDWSAQIADAAAEDPRRTFSLAEHAEALLAMKAYPPARASYLETWLDCWNGGGADADGDGLDLCHDCDDADALQSPAAVEVCDAIDNDCNGRVDDVAGSETPCGDPDTARRAALWHRVFDDVKARARRGAAATPPPVPPPWFLR